MTSSTAIGFFSKPSFFTEKSVKLKYKCGSVFKCSFNSELFLFEPNQISLKLGFQKSI